MAYAPKLEQREDVHVLRGGKWVRGTLWRTLTLSRCGGCRALIPIGGDATRAHGPRGTNALACSECQPFHAVPFPAGSAWTDQPVLWHQDRFRPDCRACHQERGEYESSLKYRAEAELRCPHCGGSGVIYPEAVA
jgi:hypothetical protein